MTSPTLRFAIHGRDETIELTDYVAVVAGYTGRDEAAVREHIDELAAIGVAPPPEIPMFYIVDAETVSSDGTVSVNGVKTSGEIEPLYIRHDGQFYLGIASDHTDRHVETLDIGVSKRACPKPVSGTVIPVPDIDSLSLDAYRARSWVDGRIYQDGTLDGLRTPADIIRRLTAKLNLHDEDFVCLGGTLPLIDGSFEYGTQWRLELALPNGTVIDHEYSILKGDQS